MLFYFANWSNGVAAERVRAARADFEGSLYGDGISVTTTYGPNSVCCIALPEKLKRTNRGVLQANSVVTAIPYLLFTDDGRPHDMASAETQSFVARFLSGETGPDPVAPFCVLSIDHSTGALTIRTDFLGAARVHVLSDKDGSIATNQTLHLKSLRCGLDEQAIVDFASMGWLLDDATFVSGFRQMRPNERLVLHPKGASIDRASAAAESFPETLSASDQARETARSLSHVASSIVANTNGDILTVALSGGRDSRLTSASFLSGGHRETVKFYTVDNYEQETETVRTLLKRIDALDRLDIRHPKPPSFGTFDLLTSARLLVAQYNGLNDATYAGTREPLYFHPSLAELPFIVSGAGGEMLHGHYYPKSLVGMNRNKLADWLIGRIGWISIASREAASDFSSRVKRFLKTSPDFDHAARALDYFYLYQRQRRWSGFSGAFNTAAPMANKAFCLGTFNFSAADIATSSIPRSLTDEMMPVWKDIPYFKAVRGMQSKRPELTLDEAAAARDLAASFEPLRRLLDFNRIDIELTDWHNRPPSHRDPVIKRMAWLGCVAEALY